MDELTLKKAAIKKQACFAELTEQEVEKLSELLANHRVSAGDTIVKEGDPVDSVFLIVNGTADVRKSAVKNGVPVIESIATLGVGDAIGLNDTGFYSLSGKRTATVVANTDMLLFKLGVASFRGFALAYPHISMIMRQNAANAAKQQ